MKTKVNREELSTELVEQNIPIRMSEQAWYDLAHQKLSLLEARNDSASTVLGQEDCDNIDGIVHLIDHMQDYAVKELGIPEDVVFNIKGE